LQDLLFRLAEAAGLKDKIAAMASGKHINITEDRAVMHIALRAARDQSYIVDGKNVVPDVYAVLDAVREFSTKLRAGDWKVTCIPRFHSLVPANPRLFCATGLHG
jgi:glucose-6-phosphate isomerase